MPSEIFWTTERLELLRQYAITLSARQIAIMVGAASRNAVISACHRYGIPLTAARPGNTVGNLKTKREARQKAEHALKRQEPEAMRKRPPNPPPLLRRPVPLWDLEEHHCREIVGHNGTCATYCGAQKWPGSSYCGPHTMKNTPAVFARLQAAAE